jgi:predicted enzyme related to lactoylglutathione lyase
MFLDRTIVHFEIPANNPEKLSEFYKNLFGWKFEKMSMGEAGDYWMIETRPGTAQNMAEAEKRLKKLFAHSSILTLILNPSMNKLKKTA